MWELLLNNIIGRVARFCLFYKSLLTLFLTSLCGCKCGSSGNQMFTCHRAAGPESELMKQINPILRISILCLVSNENKSIYLAAVH